MDRQTALSLVDRGALLLGAKPSGEKNGHLILVDQIKAWISQANSLNGDQGIKPVTLRVKGVQKLLEEKLKLLNKIKPEE